MILALRLLPFFAVAGLTAVIVVGWQDRKAKIAEISDLNRELAVQTRINEQTALARDVARAETDRLRRAAEEYDALREALLQGDENAPLPDWFRAYLGRLFPAP